MSKDKFKTMDELFKELIPNYDEWKAQMKEDRKSENAVSRLKYLSLLKENYPQHINKLSKEDTLFLLRQTRFIYHQLNKELIDNKITSEAKYNYDTLHSVLALNKDEFEKFINKDESATKELASNQLLLLIKELENTYRTGLNKWVFANKNYRLKDLINDINEIKFARLIKEKESELFDDYLKMYIHLKHKSSIKLEKETFIYINEYIEDEETFFDVSGYVENETTSYALEFNPWSEWLSYLIASNTLERLSKEEILYYCLWEMSFVSFDEEDIQDEFNEIKIKTDEIENELYDKE